MSTNNDSYWSLCGARCAIAICRIDVCLVVSSVHCKMSENSICFFFFTTQSNGRWKHPIINTCCYYYLHRVIVAGTTCQHRPVPEHQCCAVHGDFSLIRQRDVLDAFLDLLQSLILLNLLEHLHWTIRIEAVVGGYALLSHSALTRRRTQFTLMKLHHRRCFPDAYYSQRKHTCVQHRCLCVVSGFHCVLSLLDSTV